MRGIMPSHQEGNSPCWHMGPIHAIFFCIIRIISLLFQIILIISEIKNAIWVKLGVYSLQKTCQSARSSLEISEHTNQEHQGLNYQATHCAQGINCPA
jgi:hypothetical protein